MKSSIKKYSILIILIISFLLLLETNSQAFFIRRIGVNRQLLTSTQIYGICKLYNENEALYYKNSSTGFSTESVNYSEVLNVRNTIKQTLDSLQSGEYLIGKILNSNSYYDATNKEFCFKRNVSSVSTDKLTKVIIIGYDDNYQFKSNLTQNKGAYKVRKKGDTEEFYVSYDDTWIESDLTTASDANRIELDKTNIELEVGQTTEVRYTILPENALSKSVSVKYGDGIDINTDTAGVVKITAISEAESFITVSLKNRPDIEVTCKINVINSNPRPEPNPEPIDEDIYSDKYKIDTSKKYISNVTPKATVKDFKLNIQTNDEYEIYTKDGTVVTDENTVIATKMKLKTEKQEYTIIVKGDIDANGKISINDVVKCVLYNIHIKVPDEIQKIAADINGDGKISITDVVRLKLASVNIKPID